MAELFNNSCISAHTFNQAMKNMQSTFAKNIKSKHLFYNTGSDTITNYVLLNYQDSENTSIQINDYI